MGWQVPRRMVSAGDALPHRAHEELILTPSIGIFVTLSPVLLWNPKDVAADEVKALRAATPSSGDGFRFDFDLDLLSVFFVFMFFSF